MSCNNPVDDHLHETALRLGRLLDTARHALNAADDAYQRHDDTGLVAALEDMRGASEAASRIIINSADNTGTLL